MTNLHDQARLEGNLKRFIAFRLLYSARFYYPVFTVLFLDYGLTLEQFAILNIVWALTIVAPKFLRARLPILSDASVLLSLPLF